MSAVRPIDRWFIDEILPHESAFLRAARRIERNPDDAQDIVRDVYARLFSMDGWASIDNPRQYALKMVRNLALKRAQRSKIVQFKQFSDFVDFDAIDDSPSQHRVVASQEQMRRIARAIDAMPERCRAALLLRRFHNRSASEAALELGISISTLEKRLARSIVLLTQAMGAQSDEACDAEPLSRALAISHQDIAPPDRDSLRPAKTA